MVSAWDDPADDAANTQWVRDYSDAITPHSGAGGYINFIAADDDERIQANYDRLLDVKRKYDPGNLLQVNRTSNPDSGHATWLSSKPHRRPASVGAYLRVTP